MSIRSTLKKRNEPISRATIFGALFGWAVVGAAGPAVGDMKLGEWLVEEGRGYALTSQARGTEGDARIVLSLMQAAAVVAPQLTEAYRWQYEMAGLIGESEVAQAALRSYMTYRAEDVTRYLEWIEAAVSEMQTVEDRLAFLESLVKPGTTSSALAGSDVHRRMAELLYGQGRSAEADQHVRLALGMFPGNMAARQLRDDFHQEISTRASEAAFWLLVVDENPTSWSSSISLARELDCLGLRAEAREWYHNGTRLLERAGLEGPLAGEVLLEVARSYKSEGQVEAARQLCIQAVETNPESVAARLLLNELCAEGNEEEACAQTRAWLERCHEEVAARFAARPEAAEAAALSWYYGHVLGDYDQAVAYGDRAMALKPDNLVAQSCAGYAHLWAGHAERAMELLAAPARSDALAAVGLARSYLQVEREEEGLSLLKEIASGCATGSAYDQAVSTLQQAGQEPPALPKAAKFSEMLEGFDRSKLEYAFDPDRYVYFRVELAAPPADAVAPWEFLFVVLNRSEFDITLGPDKMLDPQVMISFELGGEVEAGFEAYAIVPLDVRPVLRPGQVIRVARTVDTGSLREFLWRTVQADYEVRVRSLLSPVLTAEGKWARSPFGPAAQEFSFQRPGLVATPRSVDRLLAASRSEDPRARMPATEKLVALWAEHQANQGGPKRYQAHPIPVDRIREAVAERWKDSDRGVRVRTLGALRLVNLDNADIGALAALLHHEDPLTRMEAVLLMADQQGAAFLPVVTRLAESDPNRLVRQLSSGFRDNWRNASASTP